jgi:hypothetical protein
MWLPSTDPAEDVEVLKPKDHDLFRRLRADGSEADEVRFERDNAGHVHRFVELSNPHDRLAEVSAGAKQTLRAGRKQFYPEYATSTVQLPSGWR